MGLSTSSITAGIAALTVTGVKILDIGAIPEQIQPRTNDIPILYPHPDGFMAGGTAQQASVTFGTPTGRFWFFERTLKYVYLHAAVGSGRGIADHYPAMLSNIDALMTALVDLDVSGVDVMTVNTGAFGVLTDPAGQQYFGFTLDINVREKVQA